MEIDPQVAAELGFPKSRYVFVEHERRWLCRSVPVELVRDADEILDVYVTDTNLRLREARSVSGGAPMRRLSRKVDVDPRTRLISSIYLQEAEYVLLKSALVGRELLKRRLRVSTDQGVVLAIDEFQGNLSGLILLEAEFESTEALHAYQPPWYAGAEVTGDLRYTGGQLVAFGLPNTIEAPRSTVT